MKRAIQLTIFACLFIGAMFVAAPTSSYACSCAELPSVEEELLHSEAVFSGKVIDIQQKKHLKGYLTKTVLFEIEATWKGGSQSQVIVTTGSGGGDCGFDFEKGREYLVYASESSMYGKKELVTILCDRTRLVTAADEDFAVLGEGKAPNQEVNLNTHDNTMVWVKLATIAIIIIGMSFVINIVRKKIR